MTSFISADTVRICFQSYLSCWQNPLQCDCRSEVFNSWLGLCLVSLIFQNLLYYSAPHEFLSIFNSWMVQWVFPILKYLWFFSPVFLSKIGRKLILQTPKVKLGILDNILTLKVNHLDYIPSLKVNYLDRLSAPLKLTIPHNAVVGMTMSLS